MILWSRYTLTMSTTHVPQRILIIAVGDIGDILLATPALRMLRDTYPLAKIYAMTKPSTVAVLQHSELVDTFVPIDKSLFDRPLDLLRPRVLLTLRRYVARLRGLNVDTVIVLHHLTTRFGAAKYALLSLATGASVRAGLDNGRGWFLTHKAKDTGFGDRHESVYWLRVIATFVDNVDTQASVTPEFALESGSLDEARGMLIKGGWDSQSPLIAIHAGSGLFSTARRWDPANFAIVADGLMERAKAQIVLVGSKDDQDASYAVASAVRSQAINLVGATDLQTLAGVLTQCSILVANDGGVGHLASAVGTPVVTVAGPTNMDAWHPLGRAVTLQAQPSLPCMPCMYRGKSLGYPEGCPPRYCLVEVMPERVIEAAIGLVHAREGGLKSTLGET